MLELVIKMYSFISTDESRTNINSYKKRTEFGKYTPLCLFHELWGKIPKWANMRTYNLNKIVGTVYET